MTAGACGRIYADGYGSVVWAILTRGVHGETCLVGGNGERDGIAVMRGIACGVGRRRMPSTGCAGGLGGSAAMQLTPPSSAESWAERPYTPTSLVTDGHLCLVTRRRESKGSNVEEPVDYGQPAKGLRLHAFTNRRLV